MTRKSFPIAVLGALGLTVAVQEGLEINLLGLVVGVDFVRPALKLPFVGRIGVPRWTQAGKARAQSAQRIAHSAEMRDYSGRAQRRRGPSDHGPWDQKTQSVAFLGPMVSWSHGPSSLHYAGGVHGGR